MFGCCFLFLGCWLMDVGYSLLSVNHRLSVGLWFELLLVWCVVVVARELSSVV